MSAIASGQSAGIRLRLIHGSGAAHLSDDQLLRAFDQGDRAAAAEIYDRLRGVVDVTLFRMLGERGPDHDDLVQSSFEQIVMTLRRHRFAQACSLRAWAGAITTRVALTTIRSRRRERGVIDRSERAVQLGDERPSRLDVEQEVATRSSLDRLRTGLAGLPPEQAEVIVLYHVLGNDLATIGALLGVSVAAAQSRLVRGRRELQRHMQSSPTLTRPNGGAK